ncbi:MAG: hypothetical protein ABIA12_01045 [Candidatus Aenigmatarchaeota archaeon]
MFEGQVFGKADRGTAEYADRRMNGVVFKKRIDVCLSGDFVSGQVRGASHASMV